MSKQGNGRLLLGALFFLQWGAPGLWTVCFSNVLRTHGLGAYVPYAFACSALSAFISPLFVGAMADRSTPPSKLLRYLNLLSGALLALSFLAVENAWGGGVMLGFMLAHALCASPNFSLATSLVLASLDNPGKNFGPLRLWGTVGWAVAGWFISLVLHADASPLSGYTAAAAYVLLSLLTFAMKDPPISAQVPKARGWRERLGLDALKLLGHHDHRMVFLTTVLFTVPLAAVFPYAPIHLAQAGASAPAATMALGQVVEVLCLLAMGSLWTRVRLKWIFVAGMVAALLRFLTMATGQLPWMTLGVSLHGLCYALFYITGQIYLAERIDPAWKTRAQALLSLLINGVGNLSGYLLCGWWYQACSSGEKTQWSLFWLVLCACTSGVAMYFVISYHGIGKRPDKA